MPFARVAEQVRCIYCEKAGDRIVHPVKGGLAEFELYKSKANVYTHDVGNRGGPNTHYAETTPKTHKLTLKSVSLLNF